MIQQKGFTLLELMVVVMIIAILAVIAFPSYRSFVIRNAEAEVQAKMQQLQNELEAWRATALTYRGFKPKQVANDGTVTYAYSNIGNTIINVPEANPRYQITLTNGTGTTLVPTGNDLTTASSTWVMIAQPVGNRWNPKEIATFILNSQGLKCQSKTASASIRTNMTDCNVAGVSTW